MALGDADLPPPPSTGPTVGPTAEGSPDSQSVTSESSSSTTSETNSGELSFAAPETADAGSEDGEPDGSEPGSGPPAIGDPSFSLTAKRSNGNSDSGWAKLDYSENWGEDKGTLSSRGFDAVKITANFTFKGWVPTITVTAIGDVSMTYTAATVNQPPVGHPFWPLEGHTVEVVDLKDTWKTSSKTDLAVNFNLTATLTPIAKPTISGTASLFFESTAKEKVDHVLHRKYRNIVDPLQTYEVWEYGGTLHIYQFRLTADAVNGLKIDESDKNGSYYKQVFDGSLPPAPVMTGLDFPTYTQVLDAVQFGLDVAGLAPGIGEACDAANAAIHLARGNYGEALTSAGSMIPFADIALKFGKLGKKAIGAIGNNVGKLDDVAAGVGNVKNAVANMGQFFKAGFGEGVGAVSKSTGRIYDGQSVYKAQEKVGKMIKKGDHFYLDGKHKSHLEVFDSVGDIRHVLNLDGTVNLEKTKEAFGRSIRKILR